MLRQIGSDDGDLFLFLFHQVGAAALLIELDRFLPLLDHFLQDAEHLGVAKRRFSGTARLDIGILQRGIDHAERGNRPLVLGFHRLGQSLVDVVAQHGNPFLMALYLPGGGTRRPLASHTIIRN